MGIYLSIKLLQLFLINKLVYSYFAEGDLIRAFWKWNDLASFIVALLAFTVVAGVITYFFTRVSLFLFAFLVSYKGKVRGSLI
jgi:hypothetical protein